MGSLNIRLAVVVPEYRGVVTKKWEVDRIRPPVAVIRPDVFVCEDDLFE